MILWGRERGAATAAMRHHMLPSRSSGAVTLGRQSRTEERLASRVRAVPVVGLYGFFDSAGMEKTFLTTETHSHVRVSMRLWRLEANGAWSVFILLSKASMKKLCVFT